MTTIGFDCLTIPGAFKNTANSKGLPEQFCGRNLVDITADPFSAKKSATKFATICCKYKDFGRANSGPKNREIPLLLGIHGIHFFSGGV